MRPELLLDLAAVDLQTQVDTTFYFSGGGFVDDQKNYYAPYLKKDGTLIRFDAENYDDSADIALVNNGDLDYLNQYAFQGRAARLRIYDHDSGLYYTIFSAVVGSVLVRQRSVLIQFDSHFDVFNKEINPAVFLGDNVGPTGLEGSASLKDTVKPVTIGKVFNISPILVNESKLTYGCNWDSSGNRAAISSVEAVRDRGVALTFDTDYGTSSSLSSASISSGYYSTCLAEGLIRLGSAPAGTITMDCTQGSDDVYQFLSAMVSACSDQFFGSLHTIGVPSYTIGGFFDRTVTWLDAYKELTEGMELALQFSAEGDLIVNRAILANPTKGRFVGDADVQSTQDVVYFDIEVDKAAVPPSGVQVNYRLNYTAQNDLAGSVVDSVQYQEGSLQHYLDNINVGFIYPRAVRVVLDSRLFVESEAADLASKYLGFREKEIDYFTITAPLFQQANGQLSGVLPSITGPNAPTADSVSVTADSASYTADAIQYTIDDALMLGDNILIQCGRFGIDPSVKYQIRKIDLNIRDMSIQYLVRGQRGVR